VRLLLGEAPQPAHGVLGFLRLFVTSFLWGLEIEQQQQKKRTKATTSKAPVDSSSLSMTSPLAPAPITRALFFFCGSVDIERALGC